MIRLPTSKEFGPDVLDQAWPRVEPLLPADYNVKLVTGDLRLGNFDGSPHIVEPWPTRGVLNRLREKLVNTNPAQVELATRKASRGDVEPNSQYLSNTGWRTMPPRLTVIDSIYTPINPGQGESQVTRYGRVEFKVDARGDWYGNVYEENIIFELLSQDNQGERPINQFRVDIAGTTGPTPDRTPYHTQRLLESNGLLTEPLNPDNSLDLLEFCIAQAEVSQG